MPIRTRTNVLCWRLYPIEQRSGIEDELEFRGQGKAESYLTPETILPRLNYVELVSISRVQRNLFPSPFDRLSKGQMEWFRLLGGRHDHLLEIDPRLRSIGRHWATIESRPFCKRPAAEPPRPAAIPATIDVPCMVPAPPAAPRTESEAATQDEVIGKCVSESLIVLAPPGTGKTHVLIESIARTVAECDIQSPADEITVLTFTRAAVAEIRSRLARRADELRDDRLRYVRVRTFDSFVSEMLRKDSAPGELDRLDYDRRIGRMVERIDVLPSSRSAVASIRFLFVDEIQDLVGVRADLTLMLVERVKDAGGICMLLGDPAQAIYDWQLKTSGGTTSRSFRSSARTILSAEIKRFTQSYRYTSAQMKQLAAELGEALGDGAAPDSTAIANRIGSLPVSTIAALSARVASGDVGSCAILTRSNLEAWQAARSLRRSGIPADLWRGVNGQHWPAWIAVVFRGWTQDRMKVETFMRRWGERCDSWPGESSDEALGLLNRIGASDGAMIDLQFLRTRVLTESAPAVHASGRVIVSTIHRSKGLEFDTVYLLEPSTKSWHGDPEKIRLVYVAATRARSSLSLLERDRTVFRRGSRWGERFSFFDSERGMHQVFVDGAEELVQRIAEYDPVSLENDSHAALSNAALNPMPVSFEREAEEFRLILGDSRHTDRWAEPGLSRIFRYMERKDEAGRRLRRVTGLECIGCASAAVADEELATRGYLGGGGFVLEPILSGLAEPAFDLEQTSR